MMRPWGLAGLLDYACEAWGMTSDEMLCAARAHRYARPRQVFSWFAVKRYGYSLSDVGRVLQRDHTTIMHAVKKIDALLGSDERVRGLWERFEADRPLVDDIKRRPSMMICEITTVFFHHCEPIEPIEPTVEADITIAPEMISVIDEAGLLRRRVGAR